MPGHRGALQAIGEGALYQRPLLRCRGLAGFPEALPLDLFPICPPRTEARAISGVQVPPRALEALYGLPCGKEGHCRVVCPTMSIKDPQNRPLSARQEAFAVHVATGMTHAEAYRAAGYEAQGDSVYEASSRLAKKSRVQSRVDQVRSRIDQARAKAVASTMIVTAQTVSEMLAEAFRDAKKWKQSGAQVAAAMGLAKVHGLLVDKTEDVTRRATRNPDAPIEIDVDHWVNEQVALLAPQTSVEPAASDPAPAGHGAPLLEPEPSPAQSPDPAAPEGVDAGEAQSPQGSKGSRALN